MIVGVGTDILNMQRIRGVIHDTDDSFVRKTFTMKEREQAAEHPDPVSYFAGRFAGKEAVFKCFGIDGGDIRLDEIEILGAETGKPMVFLSGKVQEIADSMGIRNIQVSLSNDTDYAVAFALAQD
jgi:holo-[acyl-carrier protein] synthase